MKEFRWTMMKSHTAVELPPNRIPIRRRTLFNAYRLHAFSLTAGIAIGLSSPSLAQGQGNITRSFNALQGQTPPPRVGCPEI